MLDEHRDILGSAPRCYTSLRAMKSREDSRRPRRNPDSRIQDCHIRGCCSPVRNHLARNADFHRMSGRVRATRPVLDYLSPHSTVRFGYRGSNNDHVRRRSRRSRTGMGGK